MPVAEIFARRRRSRRSARSSATAVADACASPEPLVIACGGGAVLDPENRRALRDAGRRRVAAGAAPTSLAQRVGDRRDPAAARAAIPPARSTRLGAAARADVRSGRRTRRSTPTAATSTRSPTRCSPRSTAERRRDARVRVDLGDRGYDVVVGAGALAELASVLARPPPGRDRDARPRSPSTSATASRAALDARRRRRTRCSSMGDGEDAQDARDRRRAVPRGFAQWGLLRGDAVVALGGGVVGDTAGFAAAVYYRGVDVVQVPDHAARDGRRRDRRQDRRQPARGQEPRRRVPPAARGARRPRRSAHAARPRVPRAASARSRSTRLLGDDELATLLDDRADALLARDPAVLTDVIARCVRGQGRASSRPTSSSAPACRAALELRPHARPRARDASAATRSLHGEAVAIGLVFAAHLAAALERIAAERGRRATDTVVRTLGLPTCGPPGLRRRRAARAHGARQEVGRRAHVRARRARAGSSGSTIPTRPRSRKALARGRRGG